MEKKQTILIAGANGMVGSAINRKLQHTENVTILCPTRSELNYASQHNVKEYFSSYKIDHVYLAAAKVGGIMANNTQPASFIFDNLMIAANIIDAAYHFGISKLLFLGSSCIYPKLVPQPIKEEALLTGTLEATNEPYAIAKIAGIKLCESYNRQYNTDFRSVMPTNLYGPGDNFHLTNSHVIPALIRKFHEAKEESKPEVVIWGTGRAYRDFLHVEDLAEACIHICNLDRDTYKSVTSPMQSHINIGSGSDISIKELAILISEIVGYKGNIIFDTTKPDGTPRKRLDTSLINSLGWEPSIKLQNGLNDTYRWYLDHKLCLRL